MDFPMEVGLVGVTALRRDSGRGLGSPYRVDYCFVFELRAGLFTRVREYADTARGHRMVFGERTQH
ncbi:nuclear transport factor 2-like protein [Streptomyces cavernicola]|uniref:SnoaL-like domain-containing protein n=1 Tax=Streptomyces cavernicola TaxID=3043613 RepID=A0ABT6SBM5_9ACTN|nr:hypothetical protein [Streptomyces sp. B-S-A6]MDI3405597.1 hypothetical protein [Streptomyces sp. B-S-A6]